MNPGQTIVLIAPFIDAFGQSFRAGQKGVVKHFAEDNAVIDFDGYADQRASNAALFRKYGEGANIVPWIAEVPLTILELT